MELDLDKKPSEGEVLIFTTGGGFVVNGSVRAVATKLTAEAWPEFELAESGDQIVIAAAHVVGLRGGTHKQRGTIGFVHRE